MKFAFWDQHSKRVEEVQSRCSSSGRSMQHSIFRYRSNAIDVFVTQSPDKADTNQNSLLLKITYTGVHWKASYRTLQPNHHKHASHGFSSPPPTFVTVTAGLYPPPDANAIDVFVTQSPDKADTNQNSHLFNHTYTGVSWKASFRPPANNKSSHDHSPSFPAIDPLYVPQRSCEVLPLNYSLTPTIIIHSNRTVQALYCTVP
jgi:hypothetical protein